MSDKKQWSRDWANFDWARVVNRLEGLDKEGGGKDDYDIGISKEEFVEYLDWLHQTNKEGYYKAVLGMRLSELGFDIDQIGALAALPPDELLSLMEAVLQKKV